MGGTIFFAQHDWAAPSWATRLVMEYVASRVDDAATKNELIELVENNVLMLDLSDPKQAPLVDILADELPHHTPVLADARYEKLLTELLAELAAYAREQQDYNRDPTQDIYFTLGPGPARYFKFEILKRLVQHHLGEADYVRIDVSDYTAEQRA